MLVPGAHEGRALSDADGQALRLCPALIIIPGRHRDYSEKSRQVMERLHRFTERIEQISIDEAFLDVSELTAPPEEIARDLQQSINDELRLPCSLGAATNKLLAKIANDAGKAARRTGLPPNAITVVPPGQEADFLAALPADRLWGVGPKTAARLAEMGIHTIGELARCGERDLVHVFGKNGSDMLRHAQGIDTSEVITFHEPRSVSQETTFSRDVRDGVALRKELADLAAGAVRRLHNTGYLGTTVKLKLRWSDFTTISRQVTLPAPTDREADILLAALALFEKNWPPNRPVRLLGVGVSGLRPPVRQLSLWDVGQPENLERDQQPKGTAKVFPLHHSPEDQHRLDEAVARLEQRYGKPVVKKGMP